MPSKQSDVVAGADIEESKLISSEAYRLLAGVALIAVELGREKIALRIADGLISLRPDLPYAHTIGAMADIYAGRARNGMNKVEKMLLSFPDFQLAKALLAFCMQSEGHSGWQAVLEEVIQDGRDEYATGLACFGLGRTAPTEDAEPAATQEVTRRPVSTMWV